MTKHMPVILPAEISDAEAEAVYCGLYPQASRKGLGDIERNAARESCRRLREVFSQPRVVKVAAFMIVSREGHVVAVSQYDWHGREDVMRAYPGCHFVELTGEYEVQP